VDVPEGKDAWECGAPGGEAGDPHTQLRPAPSPRDSDLCVVDVDGSVILSLPNDWFSYKVTGLNRPICSDFREPCDGAPPTTSKRSFGDNSFLARVLHLHRSASEYLLGP
jgi:hypothetical protein